jgi:hypothetical protein
MKRHRSLPPFWGAVCAMLLSPGCTAFSLKAFTRGERQLGMVLLIVAMMSAGVAIRQLGPWLKRL